MPAKQTLTTYQDAGGYSPANVSIYAGVPTTWTIEEVCATFGMGHANSRLDHTLTRLERFGIITRRGPVIAVRLMLAPLTRRQREALPAYLCDALPT